MINISPRAASSSSARKSAAALAVGVINPLAGVGSYVAQWVLSKPISAMATQTLRVQGPLGDPVVTRLQGSEAMLAEQQVLKNHAAPTAFNPLWDWAPITGRRLRELDIQSEEDDVESETNPSSATSSEPASAADTDTAAPVPPQAEASSAASSATVPASAQKAAQDASETAPVLVP